MRVIQNQRVRQRQHQRDVGAGTNLQPVARDVLRQIVAQRPDQNEATAALARGGHVAALAVQADAAGSDPRILQRHAAEGEHDLGL